MAARLDEVRLDLAGGWVDRTPLLEWAAEAQLRRPVMLVTLQSAPVGSAATQFAVEATIESGRSLVTVNIVKLSHSPTCSPSASDALHGPATLAALLGCDVHCVRIRTASPSAALLEFAAECQPSVVVFGTYPAAVPERDRKAHDKLTRTLCGKVPCLVWHPRWAGEPSFDGDGQPTRPGTVGGAGTPANHTRRRRLP